MEIKKILVPLNGSKNSIRGLDLAITMASQCNASITGLFCSKFQPSEKNEIASLDKAIFDSVKRKRDTEIKQILETASKRTEKERVTFEFKIVSGKIGPSILSYAKKNNFEIIIIGSRGRGTTKEMVFGSASNYILHKSPIPVAIVK